MTLKGSTSEHFSGPCLELAPIGWQLFAPGFSLRDRSAFSLTFGTFATRLLAQPLSSRPGLSSPGLFVPVPQNPRDNPPLSQALFSKIRHLAYTNTPPGLCADPTVTCILGDMATLWVRRWKGRPCLQRKDIPKWDEHYFYSR